MSSDPKLEEINKEIDKMSLEELLYLRMSPQTYINKKFEKEIAESEKLINEIEKNNQNAKRNEEEINSQNAQILNECNQLKMEIEQTKDRINKLMLQKNQINKQPTKNEFISMLDQEIKNNFKTPDFYFREFSSKKISQNEFEDAMKNLGTGKNYYYYKILLDKLKEM